MNALCGRQIELVARPDVEGVIPGAEIADDAVDPIFVGAVRVGQQSCALRAFAALALPGGGVSDEEALIAGEAVDHRRFAMTRDIAAISGISGFEPAEIGEIFAEGQVALDADAGDR